MRYMLMLCALLFAFASGGVLVEIAVKGVGLEFFFFAFAALALSCGYFSVAAQSGAVR